MRNREMNRRGRQWTMDERSKLQLRHLNNIVNWETNMKTHHVLEEIEKERRRQISEEGFDAEHDDAEHEIGHMAKAAGCYLIYGRSHPHDASPPSQWPWRAVSWKPRDDRRNLVRAGALVVAQIEQIDRFEPAASAKAAANPPTHDTIDLRMRILEELIRHDPPRTTERAKELAELAIEIANTITKS